MKRVLTGNMLLAISLLAVTAADGHRARADASHVPDVAGLWLGAAYYGDPADPATPTEGITATLHRDGTYIVNSTAATGSHPLNPGAKSTEQGVWRRRGRELWGRGFWFDEGGGGAGFSIARSVSHLQLVERDQLSGLFDLSFVPCGGGPAFCPDPATLEPLRLGEGLGPFPVLLRRVH